MARGRTHSPEFKLEVVRQIASGTKRPVQVCREYGPANSVVDRWRHEYAARGEAAFTPSEVTGDAALEGRIAELVIVSGNQDDESPTDLRQLSAEAADLGLTRLKHRADALLGGHSYPG